MKILPKKEFEQLAIEQKFTHPSSVIGFIDKETHEATVPAGIRTRIKLHEVGHEVLGHFPKAVQFYGKGRKDVYKMTQTWRQAVDDEIEAEMYSYGLMGKKITAKVGMMALRQLLAAGWNSYRALSLVIGRMRHYGIEVSWKDREEIASIVERSGWEPVKGYGTHTTEHKGQG